MTTQVHTEQPGVRSVKQEATQERISKTTRKAAYIVIAVGLVLLIGFLAATGTKVIDISALQGKGEGVAVQQPASPKEGGGR